MNFFASQLLNKTLQSSVLHQTTDSRIIQQEVQRHNHGPWPDTILKQEDDEINSC